MENKIVIQNFGPVKEAQINLNGVSQKTGW
jgi:hypothetical protein